MKRILTSTAASSALLLTNASNVFAGTFPVGTVTQTNTVASTTQLGTIVGVFVGFLVVIAILAAVIYIVLGAFQWITSGGDKSKVESARNHIVAAIVGLVIIALSFVIINIVTSLLGIGPITNLSIPTLGP